LWRRAATGLYLFAEVNATGSFAVPVAFGLDADADRRRDADIIAGNGGSKP